MSYRNAKRLISTTLLLGVFMVSVRCYGIREDELWCEEAIANVDGCCEGFATQTVSCKYEYHKDMCGGEFERHPDLSVKQSRRLSEMSCEELEGGGICTRAAAGALGSWQGT